MNVRLPPGQLGPLDAWIEAQGEPKPSRPEAIRIIVDKMLNGGNKGQSVDPNLLFEIGFMLGSDSDLRCNLDNWINAQAGPKPSRPEAIQRIVKKSKFKVFISYGADDKSSFRELFLRELEKSSD